MSTPMSYDMIRPSDLRYIVSFEQTTIDVGSNAHLPL